MRYVDLHVHVSLKTMLGKDSAKKPTCWTDLNVSDPIDKLSKGTFDSQSSLSQLARGKCSLAVAVIYPLETKLADADILQVLARLIDGKFCNKRLRDVKTGHWTSFQYANDELKHILLTSNQMVDGVAKKIKVLEQWSDYNPGDEHTVHTIFTIEGGHTITYGRNEKEDISKMLANLKHFRSACPLFYYTMAHMQQMNFANHAYGIKGAGKFYFVPRGAGLTDFGKKLIDSCYTDFKARKVLIDVKHMSLRSRLDFYEYRASKGYGMIPVMASHVGVTGISKDDHSYIRKLVQPLFRKYYKLVYEQVPGKIDGTFFNPSTINLFDEDIIEILNSKGLIGISFDLRIIGGVQKKPKEYMSSSEKYMFKSKAGSTMVVSNDAADLEDEDDDGDILDSGGVMAPGTKGVLFFANQILHILQIGKKIGIDATNHLAIGTDFDGLQFARVLSSDLSAWQTGRRVQTVYD
jgi:microsomal dipeptidase-like Zn-dependent dipeptidase